MTHQIKRYGTSAAERPDGIFCLYAEYEKVVAECERLREVARKQYYELEGVVVDAERGHGFDETCLNTIKRVQGELAAMSKETA
jgi:hypothetical protein